MNNTQQFQHIEDKVKRGERISNEECLFLYEEGDVAYLGKLANIVRERKNEDRSFFIQNFHIELTNLCVFHCNFCSYKKNKGNNGWVYSKEEVIAKAKEYIDKPNVREVHLTEGVHPKWDLDYYCDIVQTIKGILPNIHVKAFSAVELDYMFRKSGVTNHEGLKRLKEAGLDSIPGGGAEIFNPTIRKEICHDKVDGDGWLAIHEAAHEIGMPSNCTILYGHIEKYKHRVHHMDRLRTLQDKTNGFNAFIPLKFRNKNNDMSHVKEVDVLEDLKNYAVSRIYLDNFPHIKAYWPMLGKSTTQLSLSFGVDDIDGTIDDSTKIYSMAGVEDQNPSMNVEELVSIVKQSKRLPVERDSVYNVVKEY